MPWLAVLGLIAGGVIVAPFAARLAGRLPHHVMGTLVGGLMLIVNGSVIGKALGVTTAVGLTLTAVALLRRRSWPGAPTATTGPSGPGTRTPTTDAPALEHLRLGQLRPAGEGRRWATGAPGDRIGLRRPLSRRLPVLSA